MPRLLCIAVLYLSVATTETTAAADPPLPAHMKVGLYITQLSGFDLPAGTFAIQFWMWFLHADLNYKPLDNAEIVNAKSSERRYVYTSRLRDIPWQGDRADVTWDAARYSATVLQDWEVRDYPFDRQVLELRIEDGEAETADMVLGADIEGSRIDPQLVIPGWRIMSFSIGSSDRVYATGFGDPTHPGSSTYSRITAQIVIQRDGMRQFLGAFAGFFVAFLLASLTYFMDVGESFGPRVGLCAGAIFATVGTKYALDARVPPSPDFTLSDGIQAATFAAILVSLLTIVVLDRLRRHRPAVVNRVNLACAAASTLGYVGAIAAMVMHAMR